MIVHILVCTSKCLAAHSPPANAPHPQLHYLEAPCSDYVAAAVQAVVDLHTENLPGDVLVFMTGV